MRPASHVVVNLKFFIALILTPNFQIEFILPATRTSNPQSVYTLLHPSTPVCESRATREATRHQDLVWLSSCPVD